MGGSNEYGIFLILCSISSFQNKQEAQPSANNIWYSNSEEIVSFVNIAQTLFHEIFCPIDKK